MPVPAHGEVLIRVRACGVCRTDLHVVDGELPEPAIRSCPATRSSAKSLPSARASTGSASASGSGCRGSAGPAAKCRYCLAGAGEPVRFRPLHRLHDRRRLCRIHRRRLPLLLPPAAKNTPTRMRRPSCAPASSAIARIAWRGTPSGSASTASAPPPTSWRRSPAIAVSASTPSPAGRCRRPRFRPGARGGMGRRLGRAAAGRARRRDHLRPGRGRSCRWRSGRSGRAGGSSPPASTCRTSRASPTTSSGASAWSARSPT